MNRNRKCLLLSSIAVLLLSLASPALAAGSAVTGSWSCVSVTPDGDEMLSTLTVTEADGKITATLKGDDGEMMVSKVKFDNNVLSFTVTHDADYEITLNLDGDKMEGKWSGNGISGKISATRQKTA